MDSISKVLKSYPLTADQIASRTNISVARVSEILEGASPSMSELRLLSRSLRIPLGDFAKGEMAVEEDRIGILFRKSLQQKEIHQATIGFIANFIENALKILPHNRDLKWLDDFKIDAEDYESARGLSMKFREIYFENNHVDPILILPELLTNKTNIIISSLHQSKYEGASVVTSGYVFIFLSFRFPARMLFTLAHELGHILAHHQNDEFAVFDLPSQIGGSRNTSIRERFADAFASNLLLPDKGVARGLSQIRKTLKIESEFVGDVEILFLARFFGVSFDVAARRCEDLEILPPGGAISLSERLRKEFGSPEKRAEALNMPPRPQTNFPRISENFLDSLAQKIEEGDASVGWAADQFGISISEIYAAHAQSKK